MEEQTGTPSIPSSVETPHSAAKLHPAIGFFWQERWVLKKSVFWIAVLIFTTAAFGVDEWLHNNTITALKEQINAKQGVIEEKQSTIDFTSRKLDEVNRENEKLRSENALYQANHDEKSFPLKKRAQILAGQLNEFSATVSGPNYDFRIQQQMYSEWENRFMPRLNVIVQQLDEAGSYSRFFETNNFYNLLLNYNPGAAGLIKATSEELNRLSAELPD